MGSEVPIDGVRLDNLFLMFNRPEHWYNCYSDRKGSRKVACAPNFPITHLWQ